MNLLIMGIINNIVFQKVNYFIVNLFVFISFSLTTNIYADNKSDVAQLETFYHQVFNTKPKKKKSSKEDLQNKKSPKLNIKAMPKPQKYIQKAKPAIKNQTKKFKDPELVAFYKIVFGKPADVPIAELPTNNSPQIKSSIDTKHLKSRSSVKTQNIFKNKITKQKVFVPKQATSRKPLLKSAKENNFSSPKETPAKNNVNIEKGILDDNPLYSQTKKTDTAALFEKAFGKKSNKQSTAKTRTNGTQPKAKDMASLFAQAFGKKTAIAVPLKVDVDFRVNARTIGESELYSNSSGIIDQVNTKKLLSLLEEVLKEHVFLRVKRQLGDTKKTNLSSLSQLGISAIYNSTNLSLDVEIKPELRKPFILSLKHKQKATVREENKLKAEKVSGFLNAFTNIGINSSGGEANLRMRLEGSLNINDFVLETTGDYRNDIFNLGRTTLIYDKPEKLQRFTLGNISTGSRNFQENLELDGIRVSKEFFLDPTLQISPRANESLQLDTDSEVELYINNQLIRRFYLKSGVYSLEDIGLYNGANNIRIRIKDEFGKVTVKTSKQYYDSHLLKPGLSLFAFSVGYLSNQQSKSNSGLDKNFIFSGYYQRGISKDLTLSLDAQLSSNNFLLGTETISSIPLGSLVNSLTLSGGKEREIGFATSFEFRPNKKQEQISLDTLRQDLLGLDTRSRGLLNSWSISGEYRSENFSRLTAVEDSHQSKSVDGVNFEYRVFNDNRLKGNLQTNFSLNINEKWQGNINLGVADYYNADESYYVNLSATKRFDNGIRLNIGSRYDTEDEFSMNLQLSVPLSRKKGKKKIDLNVLADSRDSSYETKLTMKPTGLVGKNSFASSIEHSANENSKQQQLDISYRSTLFETKLTARNKTTNTYNSSSQELDFGFNTALACVGRSCATSYPIDDSFALVSGPSNQTQPIALSNSNIRFRYSEGNDTGLPDNYSALIKGKNKKAVVLLKSYVAQNINIDEGTLPNGYNSEKTEFSIFPKYHQGFLVKAGGEPATIIDGMLYDVDNKILGFKGGQWIPLNKGKAVAFFSNKGGKFRITSIPAGKYKLELFDFPDMDPVHIYVPDTKGKVHDIGNIIIKTPN